MTTHPSDRHDRHDRHDRPDPRAAAPRAAAAAAALILAAALAGSACDLIERAGPQPTPSRATNQINLDVPRIMRGTVASETIIVGYPQAGDFSYANTVVRGWGLVVDLEGTGSRDVPAGVRAYMLQEIARHGFGRESTGWGDLKPEAVLDSPDTAVVVVEAVVPPGAVKSSRFDVRVYADPRTGTTSLEGGRLYTTDLRPEPGALALGRGQGFPLAQARGDVFINPFVEPGGTSRDTVDRTVGRVLHGGAMIKNMPLKLQLVTPGHTRARLIVSAVNTRFPQESGQRDPTARGESDERIEITVPPSFFGRTDEFVALLQHTTIRTVQPEAVALSVRRALLQDPAAAAAAALRWQALGVKCLPTIRDLYDDASELVRLAALSAGARLNDAMAIPSLIDMTRAGSATSRLQAIDMLAAMSLNPQIDQALRTLLDDSFLEVRLSAYQALADRGDPYLTRFGVPGKFTLDIVESTKPMVYITQQGRPRIVLFGTDMAVRKPLLVQAWSNRLMIQGEPADELVEVYFRPPGALQGDIHRVQGRLDKLIRFMAHDTTIEAPSPGLGLSYAETVGAVHQIWSQGYLNADFKAEQDRIAAAILLREQQERSDVRPETSTPGTVHAPPAGGAPAADGPSDLERLEPAPTVRAPTG